MAGYVDTKDGKVKAGQYDALLEEMLQKWSSDTDRWAPIRAEAAEDMRYVAGDPWENKDRRAREAAGRPVGSYDEISQYTNQVVNDIRQHKRAINVTPIGAGANDKTAELRRNLFRQIEYRSNAQQAYTCAFQNEVERSYGFARLKAQYCSTPQHSGGSGSAFNQELIIEPLPNPDLVTVDFDHLKPDGSDMRHAWIAESWDLADYKRRWPQAKIRDFSLDLQTQAPTWIDARKIRIAEYFNISTTARGLYLFENARELPDGSAGDLEVFEDDLETDPAYAHLKDATPDDEREVEVPTVKKYLTNGFEVLEKPTVWPGKSIPIVTFYGKIIYVQKQGQVAEKQILSLVRLARDPYMLYCYIRACEQELVGMTPKVPYFVRRGSLKADQLLLLQKSLHEPVSVIEVETADDTLAPGEHFDFPQRNPYEPAIQQLEALAEAMRRAIQSAMAISPLPTQAQRMNEKSGVALEQIHDAEQQGSFHFVDNYEMGLTRIGALLNEVAPTYYDTARTITVRNKSDETTQVRINDPDPASWPEGQDEMLSMVDGEHDVTLSAGPSFDSERDAANNFVDTFVPQVEGLAPVLGNATIAKLLALLIKLKNLGPIGDEIATLLMPPDPNSGMVPAEQMQALQGKLQELQQAIATKQAEGKNAIDVANVNGQWALKRQIASTFGTVAMTDAKIDAENARTAEESFNERALAVMGARETAIDRIHDVVMKGMDQTHEKDLQAGQVGHDSAVLALEHQHAAKMAQMAPPLDPNAVVAGASSAAGNAPSGEPAQPQQPGP
jgi:hypothetical protein